MAISLINDYNYGAHPQVLQRLVDTNMIAEPGYGDDSFTQAATEKIRQWAHCPQAHVTFVSGGTQTNQLVIDLLLQPYEGVIATISAHIAWHEAGAIEFTGHKVITLPEHDGKLLASDVRQYLHEFELEDTHEHMVQPGMIYITQPTELGTLYTLEELEELSALAHSSGLPLFIDGARLGYALQSPACDVTPADLARLSDVFYIGGTKMGALCGEAVVFTRPELVPRHLLTRIKQHGALLAKGRLCSVQFDALFTHMPDVYSGESQTGGVLYDQIGTHADNLAVRLHDILAAKGYCFLNESVTNQQFVIVPAHVVEQFKQVVDAGVWEHREDGSQVLRLVTCWATRTEDIESLEEKLPSVRG